MDEIKIDTVSRRIAQEKTRNTYECRFCHKQWITTKAGLGIHERQCIKNPNRFEHHKISEEGRKRLSEIAKARHAGGYSLGKKGGSGHKGYYKGLYCMSSWELAFVYYQIEHNIKVEQCTEHFTYEMYGKVHKYTPDFIINGVYYEIKNWHRPDTDFKINQFPKDKKLILIEGEENKKYLEYVRNRVGFKFWEILYDNVKPNKKPTLSKKNDLEIKRWESICNSNIDFSKFGWVKKISLIWNIAENKAGKYIRKHYPDFYENECFKRT